jgi:hypothetical protein
MLAPAPLTGAPFNRAWGAWQEDIALFRTAMEALHPGLWRYQSPDDWRERLKLLNERVRHDPAFESSWRALAGTIAGIRCGHTKVGPWNQEAPEALAILERRNRLPFRFRWRDGAMIVSEPLVEAPGLVPGARVLAIDSETDGSILRKLMPLVRADGGNDGARMANLEVRPWDAGPDFDLLHGLGGKRSGSIRCRIEVPGAAPVDLDLPLMGEEARPSPRKDASAGWRVLHREDATILSMPTWAVYSGGFAWRPWLDQAIDAAIDRGSRRLVLDLRGNAGGLDEVGDAILARLIDRPLPPAPWVAKVRYRTLPEAFAPHVKSWSDRYRTLGVEATGPDAQGLLSLPTGQPALAPGGRRFAGRLFVLVDGACASATFLFAHRVRSNRLGLVVGEPTGGSLKGINGGTIVFLTLPNSGLVVDLPLVATMAPGNVDDAPLMPDLAAPVTRASLFERRDPALEAALTA